MPFWSRFKPFPVDGDAWIPLPDAGHADRSQYVCLDPSALPEERVRKGMRQSRGVPQTRPYCERALQRTGYVYEDLVEVVDGLP
jgi:hypothetical protein